MSVGNTPRSRKPRLKASRGLAVWSLPIHLGGSDCFLARKTWTMAASSRTRTMTSTVWLDPPPHGGAPGLSR
jgi:hypothetical protein